MRVMFIVVFMLFSGFPVLAQIIPQISPEDFQAVDNMTKSFAKWAQVQQQDFPKTPEEMLKLVQDFIYIRDYAKLTSEKFLKSVDSEFAQMFRDKFQAGAENMAKGLAGLMKKPNDANAQALLKKGQSLMMEFHQYYTKQTNRVAEQLQQQLNPGSE
ncbi:MAG: hypothetical protein HQM11_16835 [SAR324 cluster bacterium]|nr:hypothetical protein [SAR324 cluster bacterium]